MRNLVPTVLAVSMIVAPAVAPAAAQEEEQDSSRSGHSDLSLEPDRTVAFNTTEGTYMNLDVSPDGRTIVFDLLGDIYTVPIDGGPATRLTSGMGYDAQPTFSPDGEQIAYISDASGSDNIWMVEAAGGEPKAITTERQEVVSTPEWDPDGDYIMARRRGQLWLYHKDGGSGLALSTSPMAAGPAGPIFSPDGRHVYFSSRGGGGGAGGLSFTNWQVRRLDRVTGDIASITASPNGAFRPAVSPDGNWLVYGARLDAQTGLRIRNLQTDREDWLAYPIDRDNAERPGNLDLMPAYDFTPDGEAVIIATGGTFHRIDLETKADTALAFSADVELDLAPFVFFEEPLTQEPVTIRNLRYVNRSPDGSRVVFSALSRIWAMEPPAGEPFQLVQQEFGQFQPVLSPDGSELVYVSWDDLEGGHVWRLPLEGTDAGSPRQLTEHAGFYLHPTWSPDGTKLAFMKEDAAAFRNIWSRNTGLIVWMDAQGGPLNTVGSAPSDNRLTFSPDGARISYVADVSGGRQAESEYVSVRLDGTDRRTVAKIQAETYEAVPSPDGRWIAFSAREDIFVAALPMTPEPPTIGENRGPGPVKRVTREGGIDLHWEDGSDTLAWTFADTFYRINVAEAMAPSPDDEEDEPDDGAADPDDPAGDPVAGEPSGEQEGPQEQEEEEAGPKPEELKITMTQPRYAPTGTVALVGADVISMAQPLLPADEEAILRDATVIVTDNRITQVGPSNEVDIPSGADVIDVSGKFIMPGMIDLHAHLRPPREVFVETSWSYLANLAYGVTTTRDVSTSNDSFAYGELVESGRALGPRIFSTGRAMTTGNARIESYEDALAMVRHYKRLGTNVIKQYMQPHRRQRQWVIKAAHEEGMNVTNEGGGDLRLDLTMVLDGYTGFEHSLPIADLYDDVIQLVARSRTWYTPTLVVSYGGPTAEWYFYQTTEVHDDEKLSRFTPHDDLDRRTRRGQMNAMDEYHFVAVAEGAAKVLQAGGNVGLGAHGEQQGICAHWELWAQQMGGLSNYDALRVATVMGADGLGFLDDLGTIEAGKLADLIVLDANPLEDIRNSNTISMVMKNGDLFDGDTLQMLWPEERPAPEQGFQQGDPVRIGGDGRR